LRHQFAVPGKDGIGFNDRNEYFKGLLAQLLADLRQGLALAIVEPEVSLYLVAQDAVLRDQIFIAHQQFLIDSPCDVCKQVFTVHRLTPLLWLLILTSSMGENGAEDKPKHKRWWRPNLQ
jgi:hypothetical protein